MEKNIELLLVVFFEVPPLTSDSIFFHSESLRVYLLGFFTWGYDGNMEDVQYLLRFSMWCPIVSLLTLVRRSTRVYGRYI